MIGDKTAEQRKRLGLNQEEMAKALNISQKSISKYERGDRRPSYEVLLSMASLFNVSVDYLLGKTESEAKTNVMIGAKIAEHRRMVGLTQEELAKDLGLSRSALSLYEVDKREPDLGTVKNIAEYFGVTTDYLLGLSEPENDTEQSVGDEDMIPEEKDKGLAKRLWRNLRYLREQRGMSQRDLARELGVSSAAIGMYESGKRTPELSKLIVMAKFYGVTLDELVLKEMKPPVPMYATNLAYLRKKHCMTQQEISEQLDYSGKQGYNAIETGKVKPTIDTIEKLADFFGVTMDQIVKQDLSQEEVRE